MISLINICCLGQQLRGGNPLSDARAHTQSFQNSKKEKEQQGKVSTYNHIVARVVELT